jgi:hypothetical protein
MDYSKIMATWWSGTCYHLEQLNAIIQSTDIKSYAYILHDKDKDESGELKKAHYHFLVQLFRNQRGSFFKQFSTDDMGIVFVQPCYHPKSAFDYLIHDTITARKQNKYLYPENERISTLDDLTSDDKLDENAELWADLNDLLDNKTNWYDFIHKKPKRIHMIGNISRTYDMLFYERYGRRYFDNSTHCKINKHTSEVIKPTAPKIELVPITDKDMPF